jgi:error-prone DNA polymerase
MLNNQPMGFYSPAILIKDAQRHGLRVLPVDVLRSEWDCTVTAERHLRLGLRYAKGLREEAGRAIVRARPFTSVDDLALRVPELRKDEMTRLAEIGALNGVDELHRRDALWQAQRAVLPVGPLLAPLEETGMPSPLAKMDVEERLWADYRGTGLTVGRHPMAHRRAEMDAMGVKRAMDLERVPDGRLVRIAGSVIVRQRPGTANGFMFLSMEDETGIMNAIVTPGVFDRYKFEVLGEAFL